MGEKERRVVIDLGDSNGTVEKLASIEPGLEKIRISCASKDRASTSHLDISERDLVSLLYRAVRAGILSPDFLNNLRAEFEI